MKLAEFRQSPAGKVVMAFAIFAVAYYLSPFRPGSPTDALLSKSKAPAPAASAAGSQPSR